MKVTGCNGKDDVWLVDRCCDFLRAVPTFIMPAMASGRISKTLLLLLLQSVLLRLLVVILIIPIITLVALIVIATIMSRID